MAYNQRSKKNSFYPKALQQIKPAQENTNKSMHVSQVVHDQLVKGPTQGTFNKKEILKKLAAQIKVGVAKPKVKTRIQKGTVRLQKTTGYKQTEIFFHRAVNQPNKSFNGGWKAVQNLPTVKMTRQLFNLPANVRAKALSNYLKGSALTRVQGVYIWALLQAANPKTSLLSKYAV